MNCFLAMEWNAKWDWENLVMFGSKESENIKKFQPPNWGIEEEVEIDVGSFNLSGGSGGSGGFGSVVGNDSSEKLSISASSDSLLKCGLKTSNFNFEEFEGLCGHFGKKNELARHELTGSSPSLDSSVGSGEPLIGLKLGKRTYFENNCAPSNAKASSVAVIPVTSAIAAKKIKPYCHSANAPRCQVEGCNLDLSSAKEYHRKHRVCENHSISPKVVVGGVERRFCQQCSRFHSLSEFDGKKRSCRKRLSDHNARRRKPQQESIQFNSTRLSSSFYDGREQTSFVLNNFPLVRSGPATNLNWESSNGSKFTLTKEYYLKPEKDEIVDGQPFLPGIQLSHDISMPSHDSNRAFSSKTDTSEVFNQDFKELMFSSTLDAAPDHRRALSLLSTNYWGSTEPESITLDHHSMHVNPTSIPIHAVPQSLPVASSEYWQTEQQPNIPRMHTFTANSYGSNRFEEIQICKAPGETGFNSNLLI